MTKLELIEALKKLQSKVEEEEERVGNPDTTLKTESDSKFWKEAADIVHVSFCNILDLYKNY